MDSDIQINNLFTLKNRALQYLRHGEKSDGVTMLLKMDAPVRIHKVTLDLLWITHEWFTQICLYSCHGGFETIKQINL